MVIEQIRCLEIEEVKVRLDRVMWILDDMLRFPSMLAMAQRVCLAAQTCTDAFFYLASSSLLHTFLLTSFLLLPFKHLLSIGFTTFNRSVTRRISQRRRWVRFNRRIWFGSQREEVKAVLSTGLIISYETCNKLSESSSYNARVSILTFQFKVQY